MVSVGVVRFQKRQMAKQRFLCFGLGQKKRVSDLDTL